MPGIPTPNTNLADLVPPLIKGRSSPIISTAPALRDGTRAGDGGGTVDPDPVGVIFSENFDDQPDWAGDNGGSAWADDGATVPAGWDAYRTTGVWSPSNGYPQGKESAYITGDSDKVRGGSGKAFVAYRFGRESSAWAGDSILAKILPNNPKEVYAEFWIKFQPGWTWEGSTKIFRLQGWSNGVKDDFWSSSAILPGVLWGYSHNAYGHRNKLSLRSSPGANTWNSPSIQDLPRAMTSGDLSIGWSNNIFDLNGDGTIDNTPEIPDLVNGGFIPNDDSVINHDRVFGSEWRKVGFYVKMNSAPGAEDGVLKQWLMDELVFSNEQMPWIQNGGNADASWDVLKIGGNDSFNERPDGSTIQDSERLTEWYAIDDLVVRDSIPQELL